MWRPIVALMGGFAVLGASAGSASAQAESPLPRGQQGCSTAASEERRNQGLAISRFSAAALLQACLPNLNGNAGEGAPSPQHCFYSAGRWAQKPKQAKAFGNSEPCSKQPCASENHYRCVWNWA
jgi:hypothetical protein